MEGQTGLDFFISYTGADQTWAEWIAGQLEAADYSVTLQAWDFRPGQDFVHQMDQASQRASRTIAVLSPAYVESDFAEAEWRPAFRSDPTGEHGSLVLVRVAEVTPRGCWAPGSVSIWSAWTLRPPKPPCSRAFALAASTTSESRRSRAETCRPRHLGRQDRGAQLLGRRSGDLKPTAP